MSPYTPRVVINNRDSKKLRRCRIYGGFALSQAIVSKLVVGLEPTAAAWPSLRDANRPFGRLYEWAAKNPPEYLGRIF